jgi:hypothetical protein
VPRVPFSDSHGEGVDVLVELVGERNGLDDHVVRTVDVELGRRNVEADLAAGTRQFRPRQPLTLTLPRE